MEYEAFAAYLKAFKDTDGNGVANITSRRQPPGLPQELSHQL